MTVRLAAQLAILLVSLLCWLPSPAQAQPAAGAAQATAVPSADDLEKLISTIEDQQKREDLLQNLRTLLDARQQQDRGKTPVVSGFQAMTNRFIDALTERMGRLSEQLSGTAALLSDFSELRVWAERQQENLTAQRRWRDLMLGLAAALAAGALASWLVYRGLTPASRKLITGKDTGLGHRLLSAFIALVTGLMSAAAFAAAAQLALGALTLLPAARGTSVSAIVAIAGYLYVMMTSRAVLAPNAAERRPLPITDETAAYLTIWIRRFALLSALGFALNRAATLLAMPDAGQFLLLKSVGLIVAALAIVFILQNREVVRSALNQAVRSRSLLAPVRYLADVWHILAVLYAVALFLIWAVELADGFAFLIRGTLLSVLIVAIAWLVYRVARRAIRLLFTVAGWQVSGESGASGRAGRYLPVADTILRYTISVIAVLSVLQVWGIEILSLLDTPTGRTVFGTAVQVTLVVVVALLVWQLFNGWIERYLNQTSEDGIVVQRSQRARTLLPLARNALLLALIAITGMILLSALGLNIAPLLAGAGVIGLAVGFGSQKLVQDVITGAFILFEDSLQVGDVVTAGGHTGVIEGLTIRTIRMRDLEGAVHVVPFSDVTTIVNLTKDFSYKLFEVGVAYREDTDEVTRVLVEIAEEMRADETYGPDILEPMEVLGVDRFDDSAVIIRVRLKTRPIKQWGIGREFNRRMKKRFDELGIEIPFPHTTLYFGELKDGTAPPARIELSRRQAEAIEAKAESGEAKGQETPRGLDVSASALEPPAAGGE